MLNDTWPSPMRALTLSRPWDYGILRCGKDIENRRWRPSKRLIGKMIALHAGLSYDKGGAEFLRGFDFTPPSKTTIEVGAIVGVARIVSIHHLPTLQLALKHGFGLSTADVAVMNNRWAFGPWCWRLADVVPLSEPAPCSGRLGLWKVKPEIEALVRGLVAT